MWCGFLGLLITAPPHMTHVVSTKIPKYSLMVKDDFGLKEENIILYYIVIIIIKQKVVHRKEHQTKVDFYFLYIKIFLPMAM